MIATKKKTTIQQLEQIALQAPEGASENWRGCQHADLLRAFRRACEAHKLTVHFDDAAISNDKNDAVISCALDSDGLEDVPITFEPMIAIKSSNAYRWTLSLTVGIRHRTTGCSIVMGRLEISPAGLRRGEDFNLYSAFYAKIADAIDLFRGAKNWVKLLSRDVSSSTEWEHSLCQLGLHKFLPWKRLGDAFDKLLKGNPELSVWSLFCAVSYQVDKSPIVARRGQLEIRSELSRLLADRFQLSSKRVA